MKLTLATIYGLCVLSSVACTFDRSPITRSDSNRGQEPSLAEKVWSSEVKDSPTSASGLRTGQGDGESADKKVDGGSSDAMRRSGAAGKGSSNRAKANDGSAASDIDGGPSTSQDPVQSAVTDPGPMPIRCKDTFCPLASAPVKSCCTNAKDVELRRARGEQICGVELSELDKMAYGEGCWQRDQLGIIDPRCPDHGNERGCCADDGFCGSNNGDQHLGCHHAPGVELRACRQPAEPTRIACEPRGTYAMRVTVDTAWEGRDSGLAAISDDGRGKIEIYLLLDVADVDASTSEINASARLCGVTLPPFYSSTLCESYLPRFPDSVWESQQLPRPGIGGRFDCDADGCMLSIWPTTYLFGIRLENPEASWPTPQQTAYLRCPDLPGNNCFADDDDDGLPGISVVLDKEGSVDTGGACRSYNYRAAPLSDTVAAIFNGVHRADRLHVGIRARVGGTARYSDTCRSASGSALVEYVNSRAKGCLLQPGSVDVITGSGPAGANEACRRSEAQFIDESMPMYRVLSAGETPGASRSIRDNAPSLGPSVSVVRLTGSAAQGCAAARAAAF